MKEIGAAIRVRMISDVEAEIAKLTAELRSLESTIEEGGDGAAAAAKRQKKAFQELAAAQRRGEKIERDFARVHRFLADQSGAAEGATDELAQATERLGDVQVEAGGKVGMFSDAAKNQGRHLGGLVNVGAELAYSFGTAVPAFQKVGMQMAMMGGSAYQLGAAFGPLGVAVGVVMGLLPSLISGMGDSGDAMGGAASDADRAARSFDGLRQAIREAREEQDEWNRLMAGEESSEETRDALEAREVQLTEARKVVDGRRRDLRQVNRSMSGSRFVRDAFDSAITGGANTEEELFNQVWQQVERRMDAQGYTGARYASQREDIRRTVERDAQRMGRQLRGVRQAEGQVEDLEKRTEELRSSVEAAERREAGEQAEEDAREAEEQRRAGSSAVNAELARLVGGIRNRRVRSRVQQRLRSGQLRDSDIRRIAGANDGTSAEDVSELVETRRGFVAEEAARTREVAGEAVERRRQMHVTVSVDQDGRATGARVSSADLDITGEGAELGEAS